MASSLKSQRLNQEAGTVLLLASVTILVVIGMLALAVDLGYLMNGRGQLQAALDASALAGAQGLRAAIEPAGSHAQQTLIIKKLAKDFAALNSIKKVGDTTNLILDDSDITIDFPSDYPFHQPRIIVKHRNQLPTIFGNIFGLTSLTIGAASISSTSIVDGGSGMISGCWRPILIPDTFQDKDGNAWAVCGQTPTPFIDGKFSPSRPATPLNPDSLALENGDFYVSRFASLSANSDRNQNKNFVGVYPTGFQTAPITGIRDALSSGDVSYANGIFRGNLMGQRILLRPNDYRIINFATSNIKGNFPSDPVQQINRGCCTPIQVGQLVQVYTPTDENAAIYANFRTALNAYLNPGIPDLPTPDARTYRYAQTQRYPTPNANPRVIPVLMCSPIEFSKSKNIPQFYVTNIGGFYIESTQPDGSMVGFFIREVVINGTSLDPKNEVADQSLLPISVSLIR